MVESIQETQIFEWTKISLQNTDIANYKLTFKFSDKGEGYTTKVIFVTADGIRKSNSENIKLDLVLKVSKLFNAVNKDAMHEMYKKESVVYNKVFPEFKVFVDGRSVIDVFESIPTFYRTIQSDGREILVLDNLRTKGYQPHNRLLPMNFHHIKLVLRKYAQLHAISFAFKDQKPDYLAIM